MLSMSESFSPRPYQSEAIQALRAGWSTTRNRLAVVLPTGAGKTVVFANLIAQTMSTLTGRPLVVAHREELIQQAVDKIRAVNPDLRVGIVKAGRDELDADVIVASAQTLAVERRRRAITDIGMVIVDECHHAAAPTYVEFLEHYGAWRGLPVAGFTATMTRADGGLGEVWQDVVYKIDILDLIKAGHLVDVRGKRVVVQGLDLDKVKTRAGDLQDGQLGQAIEDSGAAEVVADAYRQFAADRPGVVFTPTVNSAKLMADVMTASGITTGVVYGDMPKDERVRVLDAYRAGDLQALANCMVLTEGFDAPWTSCAVIARPTKSAGLYIQMAGRALRLHPGKTDALLLDVMGSSTRHKLASIVDLSSRQIPVPQDDQTLAEAAAIPEVPSAAGPGRLRAQWEDVDLFHDSRAAWLRTEGGTWFITTGGGSYIFLTPGEQPGLFRIRRWTPDGGVQAPPGDRDFSQHEAMHWAEVGAYRLGGHGLSTREVAWRAKPASPKQLGLCRHRGVRVGPGWTAGDVADALDIADASKHLDPRLAAHAAA